MQNKRKTKGGSMTKRKSIRYARRKRMAELIQEGIYQGKKELLLLEILPRFEAEATFPRLSGLHVFVDHQYLNAPHPGNGGHRPRRIKLDSLAKKYAKEILGRKMDLDWIPDGTPIGDPIFSLTKAPRIA